MRLTLITSYKPFHKDAEYAQLQRDALTSWLPVVDEVIYLNHREWGLDNEKVTFIPAEDFPTVTKLAAFASSRAGITFWPTADLILAKNFRSVIEECVAAGFQCGTTCRHNFDKKTKDLSKAEFHQGGYDLFYATSEIWADIAVNIPECFRVGTPIYDAWFLQYLGTKWGHTFCNFHRKRCVFHPLGTGIGTSATDGCKTIGDWYRDNKDSALMTAQTHCAIV